MLIRYCNSSSEHRFPMPSSPIDPCSSLPDPSNRLSDADNALLDTHLVAYLRAYEDYVACMIEIESQLKDGHICISKARRDLLRNNCALGPTLFPREMQPLIVAVDEDQDETGMPHMLRYHFSESGASIVACHDDGEASCDGGGVDDDAIAMTSADSDRETMAALERMGLSPEMQREIAQAVRDDGDDVAVAYGDSIAIDSRRGRGARFDAKSSMHFSAGGLDELKRAQFQAAIASDEAASDDRPKPQEKPDSRRDPLKWFTVLPPPSLRQTQRSFRRAVETAIAIANAKAKMQDAREQYESLRRVVDEPPSHRDPHD